MNLMDFSYDSVRETIKLLKMTGYEFCTLNNCKLHSKPVVLRHDIDVSIEKAIKLAKVETEEGGKSTYYVMLTSDMYNAFSKSSRQGLKEIVSLGHDIGLHFDENAYEREALEKNVLKEKHLLEDIIGLEVRQVSFHKPSKAIINEDIKIFGMENSYDKEAFYGLEYVSDSWHTWKKDLKRLIYESNGLQILTHPVWYHETRKSREDSIRTLLSNDNYTERLRMAIFPEGVTIEECLNK